MIFLTTNKITLFLAQLRLMFIKLLITPRQPDLTSSRGDVLQHIRTYGAHSDLGLVVGASHRLCKCSVVVLVDCEK